MKDSEAYREHTSWMSWRLLFYSARVWFKRVRNLTKQELTSLASAKISSLFVKVYVGVWTALIDMTVVEVLGVKAGEEKAATEPAKIKRAAEENFIFVWMLYLFRVQYNCN